jgi:hypothetical protein
MDDYDNTGENHGHITSNGTEVQFSGPDGALTQEWQIYWQWNGTMAIQNASSRLVVSDVGDPNQQYYQGWYAGLNQEWRMVAPNPAY